MAKDIPKVVALNSESDDELEIVSENISNYGGSSTPVEVSLELQEKIRVSLEKGGNLPGKIKAIKVYAIRGNSHHMGSVQTVRARFQQSNGQMSQTIKVGSSINALFSNAIFPNQVQDIGNNNSKLNKTGRASEKQYQAQNSSEPPMKIMKRSQQQLQDDAHPKVSDRPSVSSSPVTILYSPIRKRKPSKTRDIQGWAIPSRDDRQTFDHIPNIVEGATPTKTPQKKTLVKHFEGVNSPQVKSKSKHEEKQVNTDQSLNDFEMNASDTIFKNMDNNSGSFNSNVNSGMLSPMEFSGDESDDDLFADDSILAFCNSPVPSPPGAADSNGDKQSSQNTLKKTDESHIMSEIHEKFKECEVIAKQWKYDGEPSVSGIEKENNFENLVNQVKQDQGAGKGKNLDREFGLRMKDVNRDKEFDKLLESKRQNSSKKVNKVNRDEEFDKLFESKRQNSGKKVNKDESNKVNRDEEFDKLFDSKRQNSQNSINKVNKDESNQVNRDEVFDKLFDSKRQNSNKKVKKVNRDEEFDKLFETKRQNSSKETSKYARINVETPSNRFFGTSEENRETDKKWSFQNVSGRQEEKAPPLWTTIFPPSPLSPPPPNWMNASNMFELNVGDFLTVMGLCEPETARNIKGNLNAPKPLVRVLRKKKY